MDMFDGIPWFLFVQQQHIQKLPINEQVMRYNLYLDELCYMKMQYELQCQKGGRSGQIISEGFLQQENLSYILQEDGSKIYITVLT